MARGLPNKKLLAPLGCQESSVPVNITGAVMANSIAIRKSPQFNIFPHCWKANSMELLEAAPQAAATALAPPLQMKTVANLDVEFARVQVVSSAESKTVVEQDAAIGDVQRLNVYRELLTETLSQREVKCGVRLEMIARDHGVAIGEAGGVVEVGRSVGMEWEIVPRAQVQGVALVVIEEVEAVPKGKVGEAAIDVAEGEGELVRIGQVHLSAIADAGRAERKFPTVDARALNGYGEKEVGVIEIVVVEEIFGASEKIAGVERPSAKWNSDAKLVLFIALSVERNEAQILIACGFEEWTGNRQQRRRLVEMSVEGAENQVKLGNPKGSAGARAGGVLDHVASEVRMAEAGIQAEPGCRLELFFGIDGCEPSIGDVSLGWVHVLALRGVAADQTKELAVLLRKAIQANAKVAAVLDP
jgi:hypothetical protein